MDMQQPAIDYNHIAKTLEGSPNHRVLRRFDPEGDIPLLLEKPENAGVAVVMDTETTGKEPTDKIIELGMVSIAFDRETGAVLGVLDTFAQLEDPGMPIPPEATKVNHITDEMVRGKRIDDDEAVRFLANAELVIAHNSEFDRPKAEARLPFFKELPWACSWRQVDWDAEGISSGKLDYIAYRKGFFFEGHRTTIDCLVLTHLLSLPMESLGGRSALSALLGAFKQPSHRIWAVNSPFETKDKLKARGYRWSAGDRPGQEKAWYIDVPAESLLEEFAWLKADVFRGREVALPVDTLDAYTRFSERQGKRERQYI